MTLHIFATQSGPIPLSWLDDNFAAVGISGSYGLNVKQPPFNARGDGVTDDSTAIALWLSAIAGGRGYAPKGTYITSGFTVPSNTQIFGDGPTSTIFKLKAASNVAVLSVGSNSGVSLRDFGIDGNASAQSVGPGAADGVLGSGCSVIRLLNIYVTNCVDWGIAFFNSTDVMGYGCRVTNLVGGTGTSAIRAAYVFGGTALPTNNVCFVSCEASGGGTYTDGFVSELGTDHRFIGCRANVPYTGFKIKASNVTTQGCYAAGCLVGYQTQTSSQGLIFSANTAYRNNGAGFQFNQIDNITPAENWTIVGNNSVENGQSGAAGARYGFAFELTAGCTLDNVFFDANCAYDNQGVKTQIRGISFGAAGTISHLHMGSNASRGQVADIFFGACIQTSTFVQGFIPFSANTAAGYATQIHRLNFWTNNLPQSSGTVICGDGLGGRGYMMPKAGFIRFLSARGNANVTAGNAIFQVRVNGSVQSAFDTVLNVSNPSFNITEQIWGVGTFSAGQMIDVIATGDGSLLPNGTVDFDVVAEVVY